MCFLFKYIEDWSYEKFSFAPQEYILKSIQIENSFLNSN